MNSQNSHKAALGILMLDTHFPRIPGDIGHPDTWSFPVKYKRVSGAFAHDVVKSDCRSLLGQFVDAARELIKEGVNGITTSCGFLSSFQDELAKALPVPVATSSLFQVQLVNQLLRSDQRAGILTISASDFTAEHLAKAHVPLGTPIGTTEGLREFTRVILNDEKTLDIEAARLDNIDAALALQADYPELGALILECTNMGPYAADIARKTGLPVYSATTFINWFQAGLSPPRFSG